MSNLLDNPQLADALKSELDSWIRTPWFHGGSRGGVPFALKGVGGDCVGTLLAAYHAVGLAPEIQVACYPPSRGGTCEETTRLSLSRILESLVDEGWLRRVALGTEPLAFGDIITFKFAGLEHHVGAYAGGENEMFYHSGGVGQTARFMQSSLNEDRYRVPLRSAYRPTGGPSPSRT